MAQLRFPLRAGLVEVVRVVCSVDSPAMKSENVRPTPSADTM
ncbi:hypothetical protein PPH41_01995 [Burkholderia gladioli]|nr:hypothetical protein [Burkholderia gladioli]